MKFDKNRAEPYPIIYCPDEQNARETAEKLAGRLQAACGLPVLAVPQEKSRKIPAEGGPVILLGRAARAVLPEERLPQGDAFLSGAAGGAYVLASEDRFGLAYAAQMLLDRLGRAEQDADDSLICGRVSELPLDDCYRRAVLLARELYGTYGSWVQKHAAAMMGESDRADIALVDALIRRMGERTLVLSPGSSSALLRGFVVKLDPMDYSRVARLSAERHVLIPASFAASYFGRAVAADADGYADLTDLCSRSASHRLDLDASGDIAVVAPADTPSYDDRDAVINGYSNAQYLDRMRAFFHNPVLPEPACSVEQTRVEVAGSRYESEWIFDYTQHTYVNYYSPAVCTVQEPDGRTAIYLSHEISELRNHAEIATCTVLKRSTDGGRTWEQLAHVDDMRWASLLELNGRLLLEGNRLSTGNVQLAIYDPAGGSLRTAELDLQVAGSAPCAAAVANGRIYFAHNHAVISACIADDLCKTGSWTVSNDPNRLITRADYEARTGKRTDPKKQFCFEEGNVVLGPDGALYAMYRIDASPTWGQAAIFRLSPDGAVLSPVEECRGIIEFPSNQSKFCIRRDSRTGLYLTLTSFPTAAYTHQRNVLGLAVSADLLHWEAVEVLLVDRQMMNTMHSVYAHAFQYVDFAFAGDDLLFVVRESAGETCSYHDGKFVTLYTLTRYTEHLRHIGSGAEEKQGMHRNSL